jgi:hypothetical protein
MCHENRSASPHESAGTAPAADAGEGTTNRLTRDGEFPGPNPLRAPGPLPVEFTHYAANTGFQTANIDAVPVGFQVTKVSFWPLVLALSLAAQTPRPPDPVRIATVEDFKAAMESMAAAFGAVDAAVGSNVFLLNSVRGACLTDLDTAREQLRAVGQFFADRHQDRGVEMTADTLELVKALREGIAAATPDQAVAIEDTAAVTRACTACHVAYREGTAETGFRFRPGVL